MATTAVEIPIRTGGGESVLRGDLSVPDQALGLVFSMNRKDRFSLAFSRVGNIYVCFTEDLPG